jgi:hypothetical protein
MRPHARKTGVVVDEVDGEVLVYDLARNQGHCLGGITALVWRFADGQLTVEAILDRVRESSARDVTEDAVWSALERLFEAHLLVEPIAGPSLSFIQSRREMMRRIVTTESITPVVAMTPDLAPTPAQAQTPRPDPGRSV